MKEYIKTLKTWEGTLASLPPAPRLVVTKLPGRKRKALSLVQVNDKDDVTTILPLAYFPSEEHVQVFRRLLSYEP